jgi:hypothetical protein
MRVLSSRRDSLMKLSSMSGSWLGAASRGCAAGAASRRGRPQVEVVPHLEGGVVIDVVDALRLAVPQGGDAGTRQVVGVDVVGVDVVLGRSTGVPFSSRARGVPPTRSGA